MPRAANNSKPIWQPERCVGEIQANRGPLVSFARQSWKLENLGY